MPLKKFLTDFVLSSTATATIIDTPIVQAVAIALGTVLIKEAFVFAWNITKLKNPTAAKKLEVNNELESNRRQGNTDS